MIFMIGIYISIPLYAAGLLLLGASITSAVFIFHVVVVPLIFKYSKTFRRILIFANFVQWPLFFDYNQPSQTGLEGARNLSLEYESRVDKCTIKLGIWHILPKTVYEKLKGRFVDGTAKEKLDQIFDGELAAAKNPIVFYFHGNSNNRATAHRILMYKFLHKMDFHTIAFDYRGFGDSTSIHPSEAGVVEDSLVVYEWLLNKTRRNGCVPPIFLWGHSLGTGISSALLGNLEELSRTLLDRDPLPLPNGLILEAPFNNLADEVAQIPVAMIVRWLPYFDKTFVEPFRTHKEHIFCSDQHLKRIKGLPLIILHAKDDYIIPHAVGRKLYRSILEARKERGAFIKFHSFEKDEKLGHKYICRSPNLEDVIGKFVKNHS